MARDGPSLENVFGPTQCRSNRYGADCRQPFEAFKPILMVAVPPPDGRAVVGVVGAGTMGAGIAQLALEAGHEVVLHDVDAAASSEAATRIRTGSGGAPGSSGSTRTRATTWVDGRLADSRAAPTLDGRRGAAPDVVIEAALEDLELKRTIFRALDAGDAADAILATNTSALSVAAIAAATARPERVARAPLLQPGPGHAARRGRRRPRPTGVVDRAAALVTRWGKTPSVAADAPGFIVNRVNRPFTLEALRMLEAGDGDVEEIDAAMRRPASRWAVRADGPRRASTSTSPPRAASSRASRPATRWPTVPPSPIQERLVDAGRLGRKTGEGFYPTSDGRPTGPSRVAAAGPAGAAGDADHLVAASEIAERIKLAIVNEAYRARGEGVARATTSTLRCGSGRAPGRAVRAG